MPQEAEDCYTTRERELSASTGSTGTSTPDFESRFVYKAGDIVDIYEDPLGETVFEGQAQLLKPIRVYENLEFWRVGFIKDPGAIWGRWIRRR